MKLATGSTKGATLEEPKQAKFNRSFARKLATAAKDKGIDVYVYDESYTYVRVFV